MNKHLFVVHCVDTEGPLYESLDATFERLEAITGRRLPASMDTLEKLRAGSIDLGGREAVVQRVVASQLLDYNDTWDRVDTMLDELLSPDFRLRHADGDGGPWRFSWFVVDHVGFDVNPRRRDMGFHNILDHYLRVLRRTGSQDDEVHWHFHPPSVSGEGHRNATFYLRSSLVFETLARRAIDRGRFPVAYRPGFHVERPDSHWLLEQFVPFDFGNQAVPEAGDVEAQDDLARGRFGDWRRAPHDWSPYHPHHDDYQVPGACRRTVFRCLNVGTRLRLLDEDEVRRAFARADREGPTVLAFTDHDFRDMRNDVAEVHALLRRVAGDFPEVRWRHAGAVEAARAALGLELREPLRLEARFERLASGVRMEVEANHDTFGPQPFLAVKTHDQRYATDNFDIQEPFRRWSYVFDEQTFRPASLERIAVAAADDAGTSAVALFDARFEPVARDDA